MSTRKRSIRKRQAIPLTDNEIEALVDVVEGELRGLFLLILLTRRPAQELLRLKRDAVVPLVRQLTEYFAEAHCTADSDALLFPGLAALPPHLLFSRTKPNSDEAVSQLPKIVAGTLAKFETTAQVHTCMPIQGQKAVSTHPC